MKPVCWVAIAAMTTACGAGYAEPARDAHGAAAGPTDVSAVGESGAGKPASATLPFAGQGGLEPPANDGSSSEPEAAASSDGSAGTGGEFMDGSGSDASGPQPAPAQDPATAPASAPAMAPPPLFPPPSTPADRIPSPDNPAQCPALAPADPWGPCAGLPVYLTCDYGTYHCVCDWIHWICIG